MENVAISVSMLSDFGVTDVNCAIDIKTLTIVGYKTAVLSPKSPNTVQVS